MNIKELLKVEVKAIMRLLLDFIISIIKEEFIKISQINHQMNLKSLFLVIIWVLKAI